MRKRLTTLSIWLGLMAMLMIHVGPVYSALQLAPHDGQYQDAEHELGASAPAHHGKLPSAGPVWLSALEMCGYCELLTLNPPLTVSLYFVLPQHQPVQAQALPETPLRPSLRHGGSHPRAPPTSSPG